jgi:CHAD domain-containing protein
MAKGLSGKQRKALSASMLITDAARQTLDHALGTVADRLENVLGTSNRRRQHIHDLRVATRRATAALNLFRDSLPKRVRTDVRGTLRALRQSAGAARDWDVLLQQLTKKIRHADAPDAPTLDMLAGYALAHRTLTETALEQAGRQCPPHHLKKLQTRVAEAVRWKRKAQPTLGDFALPLIGDLVKGFNRLADRPNPEWSMLHEVRIAGKRLRYTLEVVTGCCDKAVTEQIMPALERLQDILGDINDSLHTAQFLRDLLTSMQATAPTAAQRYKSVLTRQITEQQERMLLGREAFTTWLNEWHSPAVQQTLLAAGVPAPEQPRLA